MIGNDIVDLRQTRIDSDWDRPRFLKKLFTSKELELINIQPSKALQEKLVWLLWTMKEATYKVVMHTEKRRFFAPKSFQCTLYAANDFKLETKKTTGQVTFKDQNFNITSELNQNYIYSYIGKNNVFNLINFVKGASAVQKSNITKMNIIKEFANQNNLTSSSYILRKNELGIPNIINLKNLKETPCSITHHGRFSGISF